MWNDLWSVECGMWNEICLKSKWFCICILYLSTILIPHSTFHIPQTLSKAILSKV